MNGRWIQQARQIHTFLGVFFSPLLLFFIVTGWWQTVFPHHKNQTPTEISSFMEILTRIHAKDFFSTLDQKHAPSESFTVLVGFMAITLIFSILLGLVLAFSTVKKIRWAVLISLILGFIVPILVLCCP